MTARKDLVPQPLHVNWAARPDGWATVYPPYIPNARRQQQEYYLCDPCWKAQTLVCAPVRS